MRASARAREKEREKMRMRGWEGEGGLFSVHRQEHGYKGASKFHVILRGTIFRTVGARIKIYTHTYIYISISIYLYRYIYIYIYRRLSVIEL